MFFKHFKLIESSPNLNLVQSYRTLVPQTSLCSINVDAMNSGDESDHDLISTDMLEDICDGSQTHPNVNRRKARYKIRYHIRQRQS